MQYYIFKSLLYAISLLPFPLLYLFSDFLYFVVFRVFKYRRKVVNENLLYAFPEKSEEERNEIARKFYRNLCDMILETVKMLSLTYEEVAERYDVDVDALHKYYKNERHVTLATSHQFNWEWGNWILNRQTYFQSICVYMPLNNKAFERIMTEFRTRYGCVLLAAGDVKEKIDEMKKKQSVLVLLADQNPSNLSKCHWGNFFNRMTPFHMGMERSAIQTGDPVVFIEMIKVKRGYYKNIVHDIFENPKDCKPGEITETYIKWLEQSVRRHPENWVWTHKRWKHCDKYGKV